MKKKESEMNRLQAFTVRKIRGGLALAMGVCLLLAGCNPEDIPLVGSRKAPAARPAGAAADASVGAPQVPGAELALPGGKSLKVVTENFTPGGTVAEVVLNGRALTDFKLRHADLLQGGTLVFKMKRKDDARARDPGADRA